MADVAGNVNQLSNGGLLYNVEDTQARLDAHAAMEAAAAAQDAANNALDQIANGGGGTTPPDPTTGTYGARWYKTQSLTALDRLYDAVGKSFTPAQNGAGGSSGFDSVYPWSGIKRCNMVNGAVTAYEGDAGFSLTPATGDVMVEIPAFYYKIEDGALYRDFVISNADPSVVTTPPTGFQLSPRHAPHSGFPNGHSKIYVSAYTLNSAYRSVSGNQSIVSITRAAARAGCSARGANYWQYDFATLMTLQLLYLVEVADFDSQEKVGQGYTASGNTAQINTGDSNGVAYHSGSMGALGTATRAVKYRGIENFWGNLHVWCDGYNVNGTQPYISVEPANYADDTSTGYTAVPYQTPSAQNGYITALGYSSSLPWVMIPTAFGGAAGTYVPDYGYVGYAGWSVLLVGGGWGNGSSAGVFSFSASNASSSAGTNASIGARLLVLP